MWCIMTIVSCILIVHYIMLMSFVLVYVTYCACVVSVVPHVLYVLNLLSTIKLYLNRPSHDNLSVFCFIQSTWFLSSSERRFSNRMKLESNSLPCPRNARPCLERKQTLYSNSKKHFLCSNRCFASSEDNISPMLPVVAGRVIVFSTASLWHWLASCLLNLVVASFQCENPVEMNVWSRLETKRRWLFWYTTMQVKQNTRSLSKS